MPEKIGYRILNEIFNNVSGQEQLDRFAAAYNKYSIVLVALNNWNFDYAKSWITKAKIDGIINQDDEDFIFSKIDEYHGR